MVKEVRTNRDFSDRTISTARWAREQIKRQIGMCTPFPFLFSLSVLDLPTPLGISADLQGLLQSLRQIWSGKARVDDFYS